MQKHAKLYSHIVVLQTQLNLDIEYAKECYKALRLAPGFLGKLAQSKWSQIGFFTQNTSWSYIKL